MAKSSGLRLISAIAVAASTSISQSKSSVALADGQIDLSSFNLPSPALAATAASDAAPTKPRNDINPKTSCVSDLETLEREAKALTEKVRNDNPKTSCVFNHETLEREATALREKMLGVAEEFKAMQAQAETILHLSQASQEENKSAAMRSRDERQILKEEIQRLAAENIMIKKDREDVSKWFLIIGLGATILGAIALGQINKAS